MEGKDNIPEYGSVEWRGYQYTQRLKAQRGHNYQWFNEPKWKEMEANGWQMHRFNDKYDYYATQGEISAQEIVQDYRIRGFSSRIICGYSQNKQRTKMFTVIFKKKKATR